MTSTASSARATAGSDLAIQVMRMILAIVLIAAWEWAGQLFGSTWTSLPSLIYVRLVEWARADLLRHVFVTLEEIVAGLLIGGSSGVAVGLLLGRARVIGPLFRPIVFGLYSVPIIALAPLLILWFGLDLTPKIVLVSISAFFLLFFNTFSGVQTVDPDLIASMRLMGANRQEEFRRVIVPGAMPWIVSGCKIAVPYAFAAAVTGELLAAREGLGSLLSRAAAQFDMTGLYAALLVLMAMGIAASAATLVLERRLLKWRPAAE
jgi:NitT/TauT family transport system permease protein